MEVVEHHVIQVGSIGRNWNEYFVPYQGSIDYIQRGFKGFGDGPETDDYPNGLPSAPVEWVTSDDKTIDLLE